MKEPPRTLSEAPTVTVSVSGNCSVPRTTTATEGGFVEFCNQMQCPVTFVFPPRGHNLFARESLDLDPGECVSLRVLSDTSDETFNYSVTCECGGARGMSTPQIKVVPPPPPPTP